MKAAILTIGNEVVEGFVLNTNATYFASKLNEIGITVDKHLSILDVKEHIIEAVISLKKDHDMIIVSGGLGPTADDITKESVAQALDLKLSIDEEEIQKLKMYFKKNNYEYNSINDKQAMYSNLDKILINDNGTANGYYFTKDNTTFCILPGPPSENRIMMDEFIKNIASQEIYEKNIYLINIGESNAEAMINELYQKYSEVYIGCYIQDLGLIYRLKSNNKNSLEKCSNEIKMIFSEYYLCECIEPLNEIVDFLIKNNLTISFAESCTAGLATSYIASIPNASQVLKESIITYSNNAKIKYLDVSKKTLDLYSAVSSQCAKEMAEGLKKQTNSDICISITGLAGPNDDEYNKAGQIYYCINYNNTNYEYSTLFKQDRNIVRNKAAKSIIFEMYKLLKCLI